jgi:hypothetical protein
VIDQRSDPERRAGTKGRKGSPASFGSHKKTAAQWAAVFFNAGVFLNYPVRRRLFRVHFLPAPLQDRRNASTAEGRLAVDVVHPSLAISGPRGPSRSSPRTSPFVDRRFGGGVSRLTRPSGESRSSRRRAPCRSAAADRQDADADLGLDFAHRPMTETPLPRRLCRPCRRSCFAEADLPDLVPSARTR